VNRGAQSTRFLTLACDGQAQVTTLARGGFSVAYPFL
jgi:hypothetical protein